MAVNPWLLVNSESKSKILSIYRTAYLDGMYSQYAHEQLIYILNCFRILQCVSHRHQNLAILGQSKWIQGSPMNLGAENTGESRDCGSEHRSILGVVIQSGDDGIDIP